MRRTFVVKPLRDGSLFDGPQYLKYDFIFGEITYTTTVPSSSMPNGQYNGPS